MKEFKYEIIKNAGVLSKSSKDWRKELNLIRWGDNEPKYDIRDWSGDHGYMGKVLITKLIVNTVSKLNCTHN